jgi:hypothetical protein
MPGGTCDAASTGAGGERSGSVCAVDVEASPDLKGSAGPLGASEERSVPWSLKCRIPSGTSESDAAAGEIDAAVGEGASVAARR